MTEKQENQNISRREALRMLGIGVTVLAATDLLTACGGTSAAQSPDAKVSSSASKPSPSSSASVRPPTGAGGSSEPATVTSSQPAASPASSAESCNIIDAATKSGDQWVLKHPDEDKTVNMALPVGFTPDKNLHGVTDVKALALDGNWKAYEDWEVALNTKRPGGPLAGFNYDYNDWCPTADFNCNMQADLFAWRTMQGMEVAAPGIGHLVGGHRRSVVLNILNLDGSVFPWDKRENGQVCIVRGFTATGRIFDGEHNIDVLEKNLSSHWLSKQAFGEASKSYLGITGVPDNALETLLVSVQRKQWGSNTDGSKRLEFQLIRSELVKLK